jgi:hypothetical protein
VLGTTVPGKSCALAAIVRGILSVSKHGHVLDPWDPHWTSILAAFGELADVISPPISSCRTGCSTSTR